VSLIVSDTTPISCLLRIGRPDLLATLFPDMRIPMEVAAELDQGAGVLGDWRSMLPHVQIETVQPMPLLGLLKEEVDAGEAAALALGVSLHADLVLMDEMHGRVVARRLGLTVAGTLGLVVRAKRGGLVPAARPLIAQVRTLGGLWVADKLVAEVLAGLGE
jgi:predicted nucleic acid-binding protein